MNLMEGLNEICKLTTLEEDNISCLLIIVIDKKGGIMYIVRKIECGMVRVIGVDNKPIDQYMFDRKKVKYFKTRKAAADWIKKHSYVGMSFHYELMGRPEERW